MARRRMFNLDIIDTDLFMEMPQGSRLLYYELCMRADDDGFVSSPKKIQEMVRCSNDDLKVLLAKKFILPFETGVVVIRHWKIHNYIQKDRYKETLYTEEKQQLIQQKNGTYELMDTTCIQNGYTGKYSIGKYNNKEKEINKEKESEIIKFITEQSIKITPYEYTVIELYLSDFSIEEIKHALLLGKNKPVSYSLAILKNWFVEKNKIKNIKDNTKKLPEWFDKKIESEEVDSADANEFKKFIEDFRKE